MAGDALRTMSVAVRRGRVCLEGGGPVPGEVQRGPIRDPAPEDCEAFLDDDGFGPNMMRDPTGANPLPPRSPLIRLGMVVADGNQRAVS